MTLPELIDSLIELSTEEMPDEARKSLDDAIDHIVSSMTDGELQGSTGEDNYFINYSDGAPWFSTKGRYGSYDVYYAGDPAIDHTRRMVKMMKNNGIKIMSYFISEGYRSENDENTFKRMYGKDASFIDCTNMMNVAKTMNDKFLQK